MTEIKKLTETAESGVTVSIEKADELINVMQSVITDIVVLTDERLTFLTNNSIAIGSKVNVLYGLSDTILAMPEYKNGCFVSYDGETYNLTKRTDLGNYIGVSDKFPITFKYRGGMEKVKLFKGKEILESLADEKRSEIDTEKKANSFLSFVEKTAKDSKLKPEKVLAQSNTLFNKYEKEKEKKAKDKAKAEKENPTKIPDEKKERISFFNALKTATLSFYRSVHKHIEFNLCKLWFSTTKHSDNFSTTQLNVLRDLIDTILESRESKTEVETVEAETVEIA